MSRRAAPLLAILALAVLSAGSVSAQPDRAGPRIEKAVASESRQSLGGKSVFRPETARIYVVYRIVDGRPGTTVRAVWYAEKVQGIAENQAFSDVSTKTGAGRRFLGSFSHTRPPQGWPSGAYRVELSIDGKAAATVAFRVDTNAEE